MDKPVSYPDFPEIPVGTPAPLVEWCRAVEDQLRIALGRVAVNTNSRMVTVHDLVKAGVVADGVITGSTK